MYIFCCCPVSRTWALYVDISLSYATEGRNTRTEIDRKADMIVRSSLVYILLCVCVLEEGAPSTLLGLYDWCWDRDRCSMDKQHALKCTLLPLLSSPNAACV